MKPVGKMNAQMGQAFFKNYKYRVVTISVLHSTHEIIPTNLVHKFIYFRNYLQYFTYLFRILIKLKVLMAILMLVFVSKTWH